jgi:hypothetical protein
MANAMVKRALTWTAPIGISFLVGLPIAALSLWVQHTTGLPRFINFSSDDSGSCIPYLLGLWFFQASSIGIASKVNKTFAYVLAGLFFIFPTLVIAAISLLANERGRGVDSGLLYCIYCSAYFFAVLMLRNRRS